MRERSRSNPYLWPLALSTLVWVAAGVPRTRFAPSMWAWLAGSDALELALIAQLVLLGWTACLVAAGRGWLPWLKRSPPTLPAGVLLAVAVSKVLDLDPWAGQVLCLLVLSIFVDAAAFALGRRQGGPPRQLTAPGPFFLAWTMVSGACLLLICFAALGLDGHQKSDDLLGYFLALAGAPIVVVASHHWLWSSQRELAPAVLRSLALAMLPGSCLLWNLRDVQPWACRAAAVAVIAAGALPFFNARARAATSQGPLARAADRLILAFPLAILLWSGTFHPGLRANLCQAVRSPAFYVGGALGLALVWTWIRAAAGPLRAPASSWRARALLVALILGGASLLFDVNLGVDTIHYGAYIGPANAVLAGRAPLVDAHCQYGLNYLAYAVAFWVLPRSYAGAGLVTSLFTVANYAVIIGCAYKLTRSWAMGVAGGVAAVICYQILFSYNFNDTPSVGGVRFFPLHLLLLTIISLRPTRSFSIWSLSALGLCVIWSLEGFIFGLATYAFFLAGRSLLGGEPLRALAQRVAAVVGVTATAHAALALTVRLGAGAWPRYRDSLGMMRAHFREDVLPWIHMLDPLDLAWVPISLVYLGISAALLRGVLAARAGSPRPAEDAHALGALFCVGALGTAELSIFASRSLWSLALMVSLPAVVLALALCQRGLRSDHWHVTSALAALFAVPLLLGFTAKRISAPLFSLGSNSTLARALFSEPELVGNALERVTSPALGSPEQNLIQVTIAYPAEDPYLTQGFALLDRWAAGRTEVLLFMPCDTPLLFISGRVHRFPVSNFVNDELSQPLSERILGTDVDLRAGEPVFVARDRKTLGPLQRALLLRIAGQWRLRHIDQSKLIDVYCLEVKSSGSDPQGWLDELREGH